jgi:YD repeat-containing protein
VDPLPGPGGGLRRHPARLRRPAGRVPGPGGTHYRIGKLGTITEQVTPAGQHLFISDTGIEAANGDTLRFLTDAQGRINSVTGPQGQSAAYRYDSAGDLAGAQASGTDEQQHGYSPTTPHLLALAAQGSAGELFQGATALPVTANLGTAHRTSFGRLPTMAGRLPSGAKATERTGPPYGGESGASGCPTSQTRSFLTIQ